MRDVVLAEARDRTRTYDPPLCFASPLAYSWSSPATGAHRKCLSSPSPTAPPVTRSPPEEVTASADTGATCATISASRSRSTGASGAHTASREPVKTTLGSDPDADAARLTMIREPFSRRSVRARRASSAASSSAAAFASASAASSSGVFSSSIGEGARDRFGVPASKSESSVASGTPAPSFFLVRQSALVRHAEALVRVRTWLPKSRRPDAIAGDAQDVAVGGSTPRAPPRDPRRRRGGTSPGARGREETNASPNRRGNRCTGNRRRARRRRTSPPRGGRPSPSPWRTFRRPEGEPEEGEPDGDSAASSPSVFASPATVWVRPSFPSPPATSACHPPRILLKPPPPPPPRAPPPRAQPPPPPREGTFRTYLPRRYRCRCPSTSARARPRPPRAPERG